MYQQTQKDKLEILTDIYKCPLYFWSFSVLSGLSFEPENPLTSLHEMGAWVLALISVLAGDSPSPSLPHLSPLLPTASKHVRRCLCQSFSKMRRSRRPTHRPRPRPASHWAFHFPLIVSVLRLVLGVWHFVAAVPV